MEPKEADVSEEKASELGDMEWWDFDELKLADFEREVNSERQELLRLLQEAIGVAERLKGEKNALSD